MKDKMMLEQMLGPKSKSEVPKEEIQAKLEVLKEMLEMIQHEMGGSVKAGMDEMFAPKAETMKEVSVVAPDEDSLEEGLEMAKEILPEKDSSVDSMDDSAVPSKEVESEDDSDSDSDSIFSKQKEKKKFSFLGD